jgi:hypothetical protein
MVDPQVNTAVKQVPEPLSPRYRNRVPKMSTRSRSHSVKYEPGSHTLLSDPVAVNLAVTDSDQASSEASASLLPALLPAPPDGFEPPTHGLGNRRSIL